MPCKCERSKYLLSLPLVLAGVGCASGVTLGCEVRYLVWVPLPYPAGRAGRDCSTHRVSSGCVCFQADAWVHPGDLRAASKLLTPTQRKIAALCWHLLALAGGQAWDRRGPLTIGQGPF